MHLFKETSVSEEASSSGFSIAEEASSCAYCTGNSTAIEPVHWHNDVTRRQMYTRPHLNGHASRPYISNLMALLFACQTPSPPLIPGISPPYSHLPTQFCRPPKACRFYRCFTHHKHPLKGPPRALVVGRSASTTYTAAAAAVLELAPAPVAYVQVNGDGRPG